MRASADGPKSSGWNGLKAVAALFLPRTAAARLAFLAAILFSVAVFIPNPFHSILDYIAYGLAGFALMVTSMPHPLRGCAVEIVVIVVVLFAICLVPLANSGQGFGAAWAHPYSGVVGWAEVLLLLAVVWLLIGVPQQAYRIELDGTGDGQAQRVLVGIIATAACALTATFLFLDHFSGGPLATVKRGPLITGIVLTAVLLWPFYRSLARGCWRRGISGVLGRKAWEPWSDMVSEVQAALLKKKVSGQDISVRPDRVPPRGAGHADPAGMLHRADDTRNGSAVRVGLVA